MPPHWCPLARREPVTSSHPLALAVRPRPTLAVFTEYAPPHWQVTVLVLCTVTVPARLRIPSTLSASEASPIPAGAAAGPGPASSRTSHACKRPSVAPEPGPIDSEGDSHSEPEGATVSGTVAVTGILPLAVPIVGPALSRQRRRMLPSQYSTYPPPDAEHLSVDLLGLCRCVVVFKVPGVPHWQCPGQWSESDLARLAAVSIVSASFRLLAWQGIFTRGCSSSSTRLYRPITSESAVYPLV